MDPMTGPNGFLSYGALGGAMGILVLTIGLLRWMAGQTIGLTRSMTEATTRAADGIAAANAKLDALQAKLDALLGRGQHG